tara:strand:+ start:92 stop:445 length:354 start_codon:yes stop_codon:yes gene_type:complete
VIDLSRRNFISKNLKLSVLTAASLATPYVMTLSEDTPFKGKEKDHLSQDLDDKHKNSKRLLAVNILSSLSFVSFYSFIISNYGHLSQSLLYLIICIFLFFTGIPFARFSYEKLLSFY